MTMITKTAGLSKKIIIKIGAKVMIRRNIDATLGLVNGTIATVTSVVQDISTDSVEQIKFLLPSGLENSIERVSVKFEVVDRAYVTRKQFPLSLSYGITIHKSQGLSLQSVIMDIGNSIFNCGQVYVALSRVTSLEGLYLINYDPSSVMANEEVIIEYNRLRQMHKPEAEIISVSKERYRKVKDIPWILSKVVISVQESSHQKQNITYWVIHGFQNTDKVSCYANAVLQCFLHLRAIRKQLFNCCDERNVLSKLMHRYENGMHNLNTYAVRQDLGEYFSKNVKRDAFEFLTILCAKYDYIRNLIEHQVTSITRCKSCDNTKTITSNNLVISIPVHNLRKKSYNLNDVLNATFSHWCKLDNASCEYCAGNDILFKDEITLSKDIVIIRLVLFSSQNDKDVDKTICRFNISTIPTTKVLIAGQFYKVMNAIFHHGLCIEEGHYISICREGMSNGWIEADDVLIKKTQWPRGAKNIYILFLQKTC